MRHLVGIECVWLFALLAGCASEEAGILAVIPPTVRVSADTTITDVVSVKLRNSGGRELTVLAVKSSCGCSLPRDLPGAPLRPGAEFELNLQVKLPSYGVRESHLDVTTDSDVTPMVRVPILMEGRTLTPPYLYGGPSDLRTQVRVGERIDCDFEISAVEPQGEEAWLNGFTSTISGLSISKPEVLRAAPLSGSAIRRHYRVTVHADAAATPMEIRTLLVPSTRSEPARELPAIPLSFEWRSSLRILPSAVFIDRRSQGAEVQRAVLFLDQEHKDWRIESVTADVPWIAWSIQEDRVADPQKRTVQLKVRPQILTVGKQEGAVTVKVHHPELTEIRIPVVVEGEGEGRL